MTEIVNKTELLKNLPERKLSYTKKQLEFLVDWYIVVHPDFWEELSDELGDEYGEKRGKSKARSYIRNWLKMVFARKSTQYADLLSDMNL